MKQLADTDPMPFGKYGPAGMKFTMEQVPADYLFYLWTNGLEHNMESPVADYIRRNMSALEVEYPDGIWRK